MAELYSAVKAEIEKLKLIYYQGADGGGYTIKVRERGLTIDDVVERVIALVLEDVYGITAS